MANVALRLVQSSNGFYGFYDKDWYFLASYDRDTFLEKIDALDSFSFSTLKERNKFKLSFTARKEKRRYGSFYWVAYRKQDKKLYKQYLGKSQDLTLEKLEQAALTLAEKIDNQVG